MIDIPAVLTKLAEKRPVFHSEADFQHALAWEIHGWLGDDARIRLEWPWPVLPLGKRKYLDLWIDRGEQALAIELKYKTRDPGKIELKDETFNLLNQSAQNIGRYEFVKDISRLEQIVTLYSDQKNVSYAKNVTGYAILLTNDSAYWSEQKDNHPLHEEFRLFEGRTLNGMLSWGKNDPGAIKYGREPLTLKGNYPVYWENYSQLDNVKSYRKMRYLIIQVSKSW